MSDTGGIGHDDLFEVGRDGAPSHAIPCQKAPVAEGRWGRLH